MYLIIVSKNHREVASNNKTFATEVFNCWWLSIASNWESIKWVTRWINLTDDTRDTLATNLFPRGIFHYDSEIHPSFFLFIFTLMYITKDILKSLFCWRANTKCSYMILSIWIEFCICTLLFNRWNLMSNIDQLCESQWTCTLCQCRSSMCG